MDTQFLHIFIIIILAMCAQIYIGTTSNRESLSFIKVGIPFVLFGAIMPNTMLSYELVNTTTHEIIPYDILDSLLLKVSGLETRHNSFSLVIGYSAILIGVVNIIINAFKYLIKNANRRI